MAKMYPIINGRVGIDAALHHVQNTLLGGLEWLDDAFGRTERRERIFNGKKGRVQCVYKGEENTPNDYLELTPDEHIGNYSFFVLHDPARVRWRPNIQKRITQPFSLIMWFNIAKIDGRNIESVRLEVLKIIDRCRFSGGEIEISAIYETTKAVWKDIAEISDLAMYHPFAGLRFDGQITYIEPCVKPLS